MLRYQVECFAIKANQLHLNRLRRVINQYPQIAGQLECSLPPRQNIEKWFQSIVQRDARNRGVFGN